MNKLKIFFTMCVFTSLAHSATAKEEKKQDWLKLTVDYAVVSPPTFKKCSRCASSGKIRRPRAKRLDDYTSCDRCSGMGFLESKQSEDLTKKQTFKIPLDRAVYCFEKVTGNFLVDQVQRASIKEKRSIVSHLLRDYYYVNNALKSAKGAKINKKISQSYRSRGERYKSYGRSRWYLAFKSKELQQQTIIDKKKEKEKLTAQIKDIVYSESLYVPDFPKPINIGDIGSLGTVKVFQIISPELFLIEKNKEVMMIKHPSTGLVTGRMIKASGMYKAIGTQTYKTLMGSNTVILLEKIDLDAVINTLCKPKEKIVEI